MVKSVKSEYKSRDGSGSSGKLDGLLRKFGSAMTVTYRPKQKTVCSVCGARVSRGWLKKHHKTDKCRLKSIKKVTSKTKPNAK